MVLAEKERLNEILDNMERNAESQLESGEFSEDEYEGYMAAIEQMRVLI